MNLRLYNYGETPPGGWRYKEPETGFWVEAPTWPDLKRAVRKHRLANNLPIPLGLDATIEQQLCEIVPPEYCQGDSQYTLAPAHAPTLAEAIQGTKVIFDWWLHGKQRIPAAEAERRAITCMRCHFNMPAAGCTNCSLAKLREVTTELVASYAIPHDPILYVCTLCGCSLQAKVRMPLDLLQRHVSDSQNARLPSWCWLKKAQNDPSPTNNPA